MCDDVARKGREMIGGGQPYNPNQESNQTDRPENPINSRAYHIRREAEIFDQKAKKLYRYAELLAKYPEVVELIELHYDVKMNNAKMARY